MPSDGSQRKISGFIHIEGRLGERRDAIVYKESPSLFSTSRLEHERVRNHRIGTSFLSNPLGERHPIPGKKRTNLSFVTHVDSNKVLLYSFLFLGELPHSEIAAKLAC